MPAPNSAPKIADGATLNQDSTTTVVDLDQVFNTLDPKTRKSLSGVIKGFSTQFNYKGKAAGQSTKYFNPLLSTSRRLVDEVDQDEGALTAFIVNSSRAVTAIAEKRNDLSALVSNTNATAAAIGNENVALGRALGLLPTTLRRGSSTFVDLRSTLDDLDVLVDASKPATKNLAPFLRQLRPLVHDARPTIRDLRVARAPPGPEQRPRRGDAEDAEAAARRQPGVQARHEGPDQSPSRCCSSRARTSPSSSAGSATSARARRTTTRTGTTRASSRSSTPSSSTTAPRAASSARCRRPTASRGCRPGSSSAAPARPPSRPADDSAPYTDDSNLGPNDCDPSLALPGP